MWYTMRVVRFLGCAFFSEKAKAERCICSVPLYGSAVITKNYEKGTFLMQQSPRYPNVRKPFFTGLKRVLMRFKPKLRLIDRNEGRAEPGIFISNHCGTTGPFMMECYLPYHHHPWGAYQMNGSIKDRFNYLYHVLYQQKLHMKKVSSFLLASIVCVVSKAYYSGMGLISSYPDIRLTRTIRESIDYLKQNVSIVIYPENSEKGYMTELSEVYGGFAMLAKTYFRRYKKDLPIYAVYFNPETACMVVDKPTYLQSLTAKGMSDIDICSYFKDRINCLRSSTV